MRKVITILLLTLATAIAYGSDIECVGVATQVVNGDDTTFIFRDEIRLKSVENNIPVPIDWYYADGSIYASNTDEIFPDEGCYKANGHSFCVLLYTDIEDLDMTLEADCEDTYIHVSGNMGALERTYSLSYNALAWNGEQWTDSAARDTGKLRPTLYLPAMYAATPITLCYDARIRSALGLDSACVTVNLEEENVKAVNMMLTHIVTTRGAGEEKSNEKNRPSTETIIVGHTYSGPLEVAFYSNPTPAAEYYRWSIYKGNELIVTRFDPDIRYTFSEPGTYRVVCGVNNQLCASDSSDVTVAIAESFLSVPNVFTPNESDDINSEFRVAYQSLREYHIWIYNRWGKLVYESTDPAKGWDGTINGKKAAVGAYYYVIRALGTDADKNASYMMKPIYNKKMKNAENPLIGVYQLSGDINLLR